MGCNEEVKFDLYCHIHSPYRYTIRFLLVLKNDKKEENLSTLDTQIITSPRTDRECKSLLWIGGKARQTILNQAYTRPWLEHHCKSGFISLRYWVIDWTAEYRCESSLIPFEWQRLIFEWIEIVPQADCQCQSGFGDGQLCVALSRTNNLHRTNEVDLN